MTKWIILSVLIISGSILGYMYVEMEKISGATRALPLTPNIKTVHLIDGYSDGVHRISGAIKLPHSCYSVKNEVYSDPNDPQHVRINLSTEDHILDQKVCASIRTSYPFEVIYDGPQDITITLMQDNENLPIAIAHTNWQNPSGTTLNITPTDQATSSPAQ